MECRGDRPRECLQGCAPVPGRRQTPSPAPGSLCARLETPRVPAPVAVPQDAAAPVELLPAAEDGAGGGGARPARFRGSAFVGAPRAGLERAFTPAPLCLRSSSPERRRGGGAGGRLPLLGSALSPPPGCHGGGAAQMRSKEAGTRQVSPGCGERVMGSEAGVRPRRPDPRGSGEPPIRQWGWHCGAGAPRWRLCGKGAAAQRIAEREEEERRRHSGGLERKMPGAGEGGRRTRIGRKAAHPRHPPR